MCYYFIFLLFLKPISPHSQLSNHELYQLTLLNLRRRNKWRSVCEYPNMPQRHVIATVDDRVRHPFPTCYANLAIYPGFKFYWEVVIEQPNLMQIGVISPQCEPMIKGRLVGCGDDKYVS
jgi:hypothetical protein